MAIQMVVPFGVVELVLVGSHDGHETAPPSGLILLTFYVRLNGLGRDFGIHTMCRLSI